MAGLVDGAVLALLGQRAARWRLDVCVFTSGHPGEVFGTEKVSSHTRGRAVDIWALDGIPVIDQAASPWRAVMEAAAAAGANEIGDPADLDEARGHPPFFSDHLHQGHLHLGIHPTT